MKRRIDIQAILCDPAQRRELMVTTIIATQAREGIATTREQAEAAYDAVQKEPTCVTCGARMCPRARDAYKECK